jgi:hypothetical protein
MEKLNHVARTALDRQLNQIAIKLVLQVREDINNSLMFGNILNS